MSASFCRSPRDLVHQPLFVAFLLIQLLPLRRVSPRATVIPMIKGFKHKGLKKFFETGSKSGIQANHADKLKLQLTQLHESEVATDMDEPGWNLHELKGNMAGHWSVKVNGNWRMTFVFENGDADIIDYQDYH